MDDQTEICATCRFWEYTYRPKDDYAIGECHRHAPSPSLAMMHHIEQLLGAIAWATETQANVPHDHEEDADDWYRSETSDSFHIWEWPITLACYWCGEYEQSTIALDTSEYRSAQKRRFEVADEWERLHGLDKPEEKG